MGTEEDTFRLLKRISFEEMTLIRVDAHKQLYRSGYFDFAKMYADNGWTMDEYCKEDNVRWRNV